MENLNTGEKVAGIAGIALLLVMFIFDWFSVDFGEGVLEVSAGGNAWEVFGFIDIILFLTALAGIGLAVLAWTQTDVDLPVAASAVAAGLGILATILVLYRIIDTPLDDAKDLGADVSRSLGVWLGLIAAGGVAYGGWRAMEEEGTPAARTTAPPPPVEPTPPSDAPPPPPPPPTA
jgi:hypothetical protein